MRLFRRIAFVGVLFCISVTAKADGVSVKYGPAGKPHAVLMKKERDHLKKSNAPDFWALLPYYEGMRGGHSASAAALTTVLNGLRQNTKYTGADEMITEEALLKKVTTLDWAGKITGEKPPGVNLAQYRTIVESALAAYGLSHCKATLQDSGQSAEKTRATLLTNEKSDGDFVIARYMQSYFTGDPEGAVGTYSSVGAFDAKNNRVLILETDRKYYEPYWVSFPRFVEGLKAMKEDGGMVLVSCRD